MFVIGILNFNYTKRSQSLLCCYSYVIVITRAEDIMADNSPSPRAKPEDEYYYRHHIRGNGL